MEDTLRTYQNDTISGPTSEAEYVFMSMWILQDCDHNDEDCVESQTGYVICIRNWTFLWIIRLQEAIELSTIEVEILTLSMAMHDLLPFKRLIPSILNRLAIETDQQLNTWYNAFEDNSGALTLRLLELPQMKPRSKHYAVKYHWFWCCSK